MKKFKVMIGSFYDGIVGGQPESIREINVTVEDYEEAKMAAIRLVQLGHPFMFEKVIEIQEVNGDN